MLILPVEEAEPGVKLALPVLHPEQPEQQLLKAGYVLDAPVLHRLREMGIGTLYVDYPDLADLDRHLMPTLSPQRQRIYATVKRTIQQVEKTARPSVTFPDYYTATRDLIITLLSQGPHGLYMEQLTNRLPSDEVAHATAVAHLALMLGIRLEQYLIRQRSRLSPQHAREVVNLGVAGMLHDIGKARMPGALRTAHRLNMPDDPGLRKEWETHPRVGYEMVRGGIESSAAGAILQHHAHMDGSGFPHMDVKDDEPRPLKGEQIHVFARIVGAADLFDRLSLDRAGRRRTNIEVLHLLRTDHAATVDPEILRIMPSVVPPFPPGVRVTLSDGTEAVIVDVDIAKPYHPRVRRFARGPALTGEPFDVNGPDQPTIVRIEARDVAPVLPQAA